MIVSQLAAAPFRPRPTGHSVPQSRYRFIAFWPKKSEGAKKAKAHHRLGQRSQVSQDQWECRQLFVKYDEDPTDDLPAPHMLDLSRYFTTDDAEYDSWLLLEKSDEDGA